jgi:hypothetical protein
MTRRGLQITLGVFWLIDACLQFQPAMFTGRFATDVLSSAAAGQASFVAAAVEDVAHLASERPAVFNAALACVQLAIGIGLLLRRTAVPALFASIVWAVAVWYLGEGLGGLTGSNAALLTGAPGAALLYAVLAGGAWPHTSSDHRTSHPAVWLAFAWAAYWVGGAILQVCHGPRSGPDLAATVAEGANGAPGWLSRFDFSIARSVGHVGAAVLDGFVVLQVLIGLAVFTPTRLRQSALVVGVLICCAFWIIGGGFSQLITGHATDPDTEPMVVVLASAISMQFTNISTATRTRVSSLLPTWSARHRQRVPGSRG